MKINDNSLYFIKSDFFNIGRKIANFLSRVKAFIINYLFNEKKYI